MAIYEARRSAFGHTAKLDRVNALRTLEQAGMLSFDDYITTNPPQYVISNADGVGRTPTGREVPVYVLGAADLMLALQQAMPDVIDAAMARESVTDRETLAEAILEVLDSRYGNPIRQAADTCAPDSTEVMVAAS